MIARSAGPARTAATAHTTVSTSNAAPASAISSAPLSLRRRHSSQQLHEQQRPSEPNATRVRFHASGLGERLVVAIAITNSRLHHRDRLPSTAARPGDIGRFAGDLCAGADLDRAHTRW